jgi:hypothetical protein
MELMHTDLPEPVAPAMSRWGIFVRSDTSGLPETSLPRAIGISPRERRPPVLALQDFPHAHRGRVLIGHFHTDGGLAGNRGEDANGLRPHAEGDVLVEAGDLLHPHARRGHHLVAGDDGTDMNLAERNLNAKLSEDAEEIFGVAAVFLFAVADAGLGLLAEERQRREQVVGVVALGQDGFRGLLGLFGLDDVEFVAGGDGEGFLAEGGLGGGRGGRGRGRGFLGGEFENWLAWRGRLGSRDGFRSRRLGGHRCAGTRGGRLWREDLRRFLGRRFFCRTGRCWRSGRARRRRWLRRERLISAV